MEDQEFEPPILVSASSRTLRVAYDGVAVDFPSEGPPPAGAPALACRVFEALRHDLGTEVRAE